MGVAGARAGQVGRIARLNRESSGTDKSSFQDDACLYTLGFILFQSS